jgi:hypothetical protein
MSAPPELARHDAQRHTSSMVFVSPLRSVTARVLSIAMLTLLAICPALRADELKLKDGTTITGTIVGFEENSFKVKTSYGFAEVQKDQVISIVISAAAKKKESEKKSEPASDSSNASVTDADPAKVSKSAPAKTPTKNSATSASSAASSDANSSRSAPNVATKPATNASAPSSATANVPTPTPTPPAPAKPAAPEPMREEVSGNNYVNETYGFRMYKPPTWKVIEGARTLLPGSITAMGTDDQTTYLLIGQQNAAQSVTVNMDTTERRLRDIMENFRPLDEKHITVSGIPAVERHFRGSVDQRDWSGVVVYIPHDSHFYTIFGMTIADTDLVQIQENVIARAISSLQFTK